MSPGDFIKSMLTLPYLTLPLPFFWLYFPSLAFLVIPAFLLLLKHIRKFSMPLWPLHLHSHDWQMPLHDLCSNVNPSNHSTIMHTHAHTVLHWPFYWLHNTYHYIKISGLLICFLGFCPLAPCWVALPEALPPYCSVPNPTIFKLFNQQLLDG
jgi:hypothetical protein